MTISVMSDVGGHTVVLDVHGARLSLSEGDAYKVAHYLAITLDRLAIDRLEDRKQAVLVGDEDECRH